MNRQDKKGRFKFLKWSLLLLFLTGCMNGIRAQQMDDRQWFSAGIKQEWKDWDFKFEQMIRFRYGMSVLEEHISEISAEYKVNKYLSAGMGYRFYVENPTENYKFAHRVNADLQLGYKPGDWKLDLRPRLQWKSGDVFGEEAIDESNLTHRNKFRVRYELHKDLEIGAATEYFYRMGSDDLDPGFYQMRYFLELDWEFRKRQTISIGWFYSDRFNEPGPVDSHVLTLQCTFKLKKIK